jgi:hypothetical protein
MLMGEKKATLLRFVIDFESRVHQPVADRERSPLGIMDVKL